MANNIFYDKEFRNKARNLDEASLAEFLDNSVGNAEVKVLTNSKSTTYFVIPTNQDNLGSLGSIQAGGFNTAGSVGSFASYGTVSSTVSSLSTAGSLGSAGK